MVYFLGSNVVGQTDAVEESTDKPTVVPVTDHIGKRIIVWQ